MTLRATSITPTHVWRSRVRDRRVRDPSTLSTHDGCAWGSGPKLLSSASVTILWQATQASLKWLVHTVILTGSRVSQETTFWLVCQGFLNGVNSGGKTKPECGQRYPMEWDPGPNKKEKVMN